MVVSAEMVPRRTVQSFVRGPIVNDYHGKRAIFEVSFAVNVHQHARNEVLGDFFSQSTDAGFDNGIELPRPGFTFSELLISFPARQCVLKNGNAYTPKFSHGLP